MHSLRNMLLGLIIFATPLIAVGQEQPKGLLPIPDYSGDLWTRSHLAGDFNGGRTALADKGVQFDVNWTQYSQSIVGGGIEKATRYGGKVETLTHLDLTRMGLVPGGLVTVRTESRYGRSVNGIAGPLLPVNTNAFFPLTDHLDDGVCITITDLNYTQFLSEHLAVFAGKIDTLDGDENEFASGRGTSQFMNFNFLFDPVLALRLPYSTLGVGALWMPTKDIRVEASLFNTIDSSTTSGFEDFGKGLSAWAEAQFQYRLGRLPGGFNVGGLYSFDQNFTRINGELIFQPGVGLIIPKTNTTWAMYLSGWQYLLDLDPNDKQISVTNGVADHKGIGVFGRLGFADKNTNPIDWAASIGVGGKGMIPGRSDDTFGIGYYFSHLQQTRFITAMGIRDHADGLEAYYNLAITRAVDLTFDAQVVDAAEPKKDPAVVLGARLNVRF
jgi:porin